MTNFTKTFKNAIGKQKEFFKFFIFAIIFAVLSISFFVLTSNQQEEHKAFKCKIIVAEKFETNPRFIFAVSNEFGRNFDTYPDLATFSNNKAGDSIKVIGTETFMKTGGEKNSLPWFIFFVSGFIFLIISLVFLVESTCRWNKEC